MKGEGIKLVTQNRKARHEYEILETYEAGIILAGSEVKSIRAGHAQLNEAYARVDDGELWMFQAHISPYSFATTDPPEPDRKRKLLLHQKEIAQLANRVDRERLALIPLSLYFKNGRAKVELALAKGRKKYDKRQAIAKRDAERDTERTLARRTKGH
jgi:SsrA-binding protein